MQSQKIIFSSLRLFPLKTQFRKRSNGSIMPIRWDLFAGICLQRRPMIVPELNWLEKRIQNVFNRVELTNSLYSDHEMRHFEDLRRAERIASGINVGEKDLEEAAKQTAQDFEEASIKELKQFQLGSSITKADLSNNEKSIDRSLDKYLYLTVKTRIGPNEYWLFPYQNFQSDMDQSLRQTAERALEKCFPQSNESKRGVPVKFLGCCPSAVYSYRYPKQISKDNKILGARIFLFKCLIDVNKEIAVDGDFGDRVLKPKDYPDFAWLSRNELEDKMPKQYWKQIGPSIYPDQLINVEELISFKHKKLTKMTKRLEKFQASN